MSCLEQIGSATVAPAISEAKIKEQLTGVPVSFIGECFRKLFFEKVEGVEEGMVLKGHQLLKSLFDEQIIEELEGIDLGERNNLFNRIHKVNFVKVEIPFSAILQMVRQKNIGGNGEFISSGKSLVNICYSRGVDGMLYAISFGWSILNLSKSGLFMAAIALCDPSRTWPPGCRIFSKSSQPS